MRVAIGYRISIDVQGTAPLVSILRPQTGANQRVLSEALFIEPMAPIREFTDSFGNLCQRFVLVEGSTVISYNATVDTSDTIDVAPGAPFTLVQDLPADVLQYLLPSRYCQADFFLDLATSITLNALPGYDQAEAIRYWVNQNLRYEYGVSNASTSALDTERYRAGVCRDFSHLGITLCRALRIPARMVFGYLQGLDPMDFHAWFEAFVNGRWYTFDATQQYPKGNRVVVAYGRDAADTAQISEYGFLTVTDQSVWANPG
ncbi:MAG TPA: transglutaminase family protein [Verrucomicrobium sp.]|nr:transglutaminase family protein [Verrucomicrobium sp.]